MSKETRRTKGTETAPDPVEKLIASCQRKITNAQERIRNRQAKFDEECARDRKIVEDNQSILKAMRQAGKLQSE